MGAEMPIFKGCCVKCLGQCLGPGKQSTDIIAEINKTLCILEQVTGI